jgi:cell division protein FtsL
MVPEEQKPPEEEQAPEEGPEPHAEQESQPPEEQPQEVKPARPSFLSRVFNKETRFGRFMRTFTIIAAIIVAFFGFGVLTGYYVLYRPVLADNNSLKTQVNDLTTQLNNTESTLNDTKASLATAQTNISDLQSQTQLDTFQINYLKVESDGLMVQIGLINKDGTAIKNALDQMQTDMNALIPEVQKVDSNLASLLSNRFDLIKGEYVSDPKQAATDLETFMTNLQDVQKYLK